MDGSDDQPGPVTILDIGRVMARSGCQWCMLPKDFRPFTTVQGYFYGWRDSGLFERINFTLSRQARDTGRAPSPSAGVIDSQSVETTESGGPRGYDAAKKVKGGIYESTPFPCRRFGPAPPIDAVPEIFQCRIGQLAW